MADKLAPMTAGFLAETRPRLTVTRRARTVLPLAPAGGRRGGALRQVAAAWAHTPASRRRWPVPR